MMATARMVERPSIADLVRLSVAKRIKQMPVNSNRASSLGNECVRYLVYERTRWEEKKMHDSTLQSIFDLGNLFEGFTLTRLHDAGFTIIEQQRAFKWEKYNITGHVDGKLLLGDTAIPLEIKSMSPHIFGTIKTVDDIRRSKKGYLRGYLTQLCLYCLLDSKETAVLVLVNKVTGELRDIWVPLDYELGEVILQKAEAINKHVAEKTLPEPMEYQSSICDECGYVHLCMPEVIGKEVEDISTDTEFAEMLDRWFEIKPLAAEYDELDSTIKEKVEGKDKTLCGNFFITGKWIGATKYDIPKDIKEKYALPYQQWRRKIVKI
jgi:CRISPR/Cas system-associated exonuclease Cas4 (RecB family)